METADHQAAGSRHVRHKFVQVREVHPGKDYVESAFFFELRVEAAEEVFREDSRGLRFVRQHYDVCGLINPICGSGQFACMLSQDVEPHPKVLFGRHLYEMVNVISLLKLKPLS